MLNQKQNSENHLYQQWEHCWRDNKNHNLTWVGKQMLRAKQKALREVLQEIRPATAIDVGCGLGFTLSVFNQLGIDAIGIDVSPTAVRICQTKGLRVVQKKLEEVSDKYDLVFSDGLLEHFLNFPAYAQHLARISNRYVLIIQTDHQSLLGKTSIYLAELLRGSKNVWEYNYRVKDFVSVFEKEGFKLVQENPIFGKVFRLLLFGKS